MTVSPLSLLKRSECNIIEKVEHVRVTEAVTQSRVYRPDARLKVLSIPSVCNTRRLFHFGVKSTKHTLFGSIPQNLFIPTSQRQLAVCAAAPYQRLV
jgi:hypothetical protein